MKKLLTTIIALTAISLVGYSQDNAGIGTTTPDASAKLEVVSTTQGFVMPRMTTAERTAIASPTEGLEVYDTTTSSHWYFDGTLWIENTTGGAADLTDDAWVNNGTQVELGTLADGVTPRPGGTEVVITDTGNVGIGITSPENTNSLQIGSLANGDSHEFRFKNFIGSFEVLAQGSELDKIALVKTKVYSDNPNTYPYFLTVNHGGSFNTPTTILNGDIIGSFSTNAFTGSEALRSSEIFTIATNDWNIEPDAALQFMVRNETGLNERMRIDSDGNVGIGTSTPSEKLTIADGAGELSISSEGGFMVLKTASATLRIKQ